MIDMHSKNDNMHTNGMFYALICINNHIIACYDFIYQRATAPSLHLVSRRPPLFSLPRSSLSRLSPIFSLSLLASAHDRHCFYHEVRRDEKLPLLQFLFFLTLSLLRLLSLSIEISLFCSPSPLSCLLARACMRVWGGDNMHLKREFLS